MNKLAKLICFLFELIFPHNCAGCGALLNKDNIFCKNCLKQLHFIQEPFCRVTGVALPPLIKLDQNISLSALQSPPNFRVARSVFQHRDLAAKLIANLKYHDRMDLIPVIAQFMLIAGKDLINNCDVIIPIALHYRRFFFRHYNQSAELARYIAKNSGKTYLPNILKRKVYTKPQTNLNYKQRQKNLKKAFTCHRNIDLIKNKNILLIDDVLTTGATAKAATSALLEAGAKNVDLLTCSSTSHAAQ